MTISNVQCAGPRSFVAAALLAAACAPAIGQVALEGISCELSPREPLTSFSLPVRDGLKGRWRRDYNPFARVVTNHEPGLGGLPDGRWQHTGVDFALPGAGASAGQPIHAVGPGVVVFATGSPGQRTVRVSDGKELTASRGAVVVILHSAPTGKLFELPASESGAAIPPMRLGTLVSYYLHLEPGSVRVRAGDQVAAGAELGRLYAAGAGFAYPPHLHFELWSSCAEVERNGYDRDGSEFEAALDNPVLDPAAVWRGLKLVPDRAPAPYRSEAIGVPAPAMPPQVASALARSRSGWSVPRWIDRSDYNICVLGRGSDRPVPRGRHPYFVAGDFDGDGQTDHAVSLVRPAGDQSKLAIVVILANGAVRALNEEFVGGPEGDDGLLIGMSSKGTTIPNLHGEPVLLGTDAVDLTLCEKSSRSYVYVPRTRRFREIWTSD